MDETDRRSLDRSCEPMDIDLSFNSVKSMDISYGNMSNLTFNINTHPENILSNTNTVKNEDRIDKNQPSIRRYHINVKKRKQCLGNLILLKYLSLLSIITIFLSVILHNMYFKCSGNLNLKYLEKRLSEELYGQTAAVNEIMKTLNIKASSKIIFLYGGTGVGKTFTVSLILENIIDFSNIYHYSMTNFDNSFSPEFMYGLTLCNNSIVIVDDLNRNDMRIKKQISDILEKSERLNKNIIIILIYNCENVTNNFDKKCDINFKEQLKNNFSNINALKKYIKFEPLKDEHLRKCIKKELGKKKINDEEFNNLVKNFNVSLDGCKGVYMKIKFLVR